MFRPFSSMMSRKSAIRGLSAGALVGIFLAGAPVTALAEAGSNAGGPAGGAFMSSYGPSGSAAQPPYRYEASPGSGCPGPAQDAREAPVGL
jgi:hypothetical protein